MDRELRIDKLEKLKNNKPYSQEYLVYKKFKGLANVYEIPTELLVYNKLNGRILSLVKSFERQFRPLNPELSEDAKVIEDFLWDSKPDRNRATLQDIKDNGQKRVGIVTKDGIIIDGNRRASLINRLAREQQDGTAYFKAVILDDTLDDNPKEIMKLETVYQIGEDAKLDYNPIEKYLKCKDLIEIGFSPAQIGNFMREAESQIEEWLNIMRLMDNYLDELGYTGIYTRLDKREGQFVDLNKYLRKYETGSSLPDWPYKPSDISDLKAVCFDYIRAQYEGKEFRAIALPSKKESIFCKYKVWEKFRDLHFDRVDEINAEEPTVAELIKREPNADLSEILKVRDLDWSYKALTALKGNLNRSQRELDDVNEANEPKKLLRRAQDTLESINPKSNAFTKDVDVPLLIDNISKIILSFKELLNKKDN